jgi:hypothetical protein
LIEIQSIVFLASGSRKQLICSEIFTLKETLELLIRKELDLLNLTVKIEN